MKIVKTMPKILKYIDPALGKKKYLSLQAVNIFYFR